VSHVRGLLAAGVVMLALAGCERAALSPQAERGRQIYASQCMGALKSAGGQHERLSAIISIIRANDEPVAFTAFQLCDPDSFANRGAEGRRVTLKISDNLFPGHEPVRIIAVIRVAWQLHRPVGCNQTETAPPIAPPFPNTVTFKNDVLYALLREFTTDREPGLACAHDDCINLNHLNSSTTTDNHRTQEHSMNGFMIGRSWPLRVSR
jgi:hypothetical protein